MIDSALGWIGQVADWVGQWIPRWMIIDVRHAGVKFVRGRRVVKLEPGIAVWWPVTTTIDTYPTARQADDLRSQTIVTKDDKTIVVGGMIVYRVHDVEKLLAQTFSAVKAIRDITLTCIHDVCCRMTWEELKQGQRRGNLDTRLLNEAQKQLEDYGVTVLKVQLTDLSNARVYRIFQSTSQDES